MFFVAIASLFGDKTNKRRLLCCNWMAHLHFLASFLAILNPASTAPHCKECPVGFGVMTPCTKTRSTKCEPCVLGRTFSSFLDNSPCLPVSATSSVLCNVGSNKNEQRISADTTHDVQCVCIDGFERDGGTGQCLSESPDFPTTMGTSKEPPEATVVTEVPSPSDGLGKILGIGGGLFVLLVVAGLLFGRKWRSTNSLEKVSKTTSSGIQPQSPDASAEMVVSGKHAVPEKV